MPLSQFDLAEEEILRSKGFRREDAEIDLETGQIIPRRTPLQPEIQQTLVPQQEQQSSALGAGLKSALYNLPEAAGGIAGAGAALALAPATLGQSLWALPIALGAGMAGGYGAGKLKEAIVPEEIQQSMAKTRAEHPIASFVGEMASQGPFLKPSPNNIRNAAKSLFSNRLLGQLGANERANLLNVGVGATIGGGVPLAEGVLGEEPIDWTRVALGTAGGALMSEPTRLGTKLSFDTFQPSPELYQQAPRSVLEGPALDAEATTPPPSYNEETATVLRQKMQPDYAEALIKFGLPQRLSPEEIADRLGKLHKQFSTVPLAQPEDIIAFQNAVSKRRQQLTDEIDRINDLFTAQDPNQQARLTYLNDEIGILDAYKAVQEGRIKSRFEKDYDARLSAEQQAEEARIAAAQSAESTQARAARLAAERNAFIRDLAQKEDIRAEEAERRWIDFQRARDEEAHIAEQQRVMEDAAGLQTAMQAGQVPPSGIDPITRIGKPESTKRSLGQAEPGRTEAERIQDEMEGTGARYQDPTQTGEILPSQYEQENLPPVTSAWDQFMDAFGLRRLDAKGNVSTDLPAKGAAPSHESVADSRRRGATVLYEINRKSLWNTRPHEQLHILVTDALRNGSAADRRLMERMLKAYGWDGKSDIAAFEESLVQRSGESFVELMLNPKSDTLGRDFVSWLSRFGKEANKRRYARILANWLREGRTWGEAVNLRIAGKEVSEADGQKEMQGQEAVGTQEPGLGTGETTEARFQDPYKQTETPEFKQWFGDSKVVDEQGQPRVLYHLTRSGEFYDPRDPVNQAGYEGRKAEVFDMERAFAKGELGIHLGTLDTINQLDRGKAIKTEGATVKPVFSNIKNPLRMPDIFPLDFESNLAYVRAIEKTIETVKDAPAQDAILSYLKKLIKNEDVSPKQLVQDLKNLGYDGVVYDNRAEGGGDSYIIFDPEQAKSAYGNSGAFSRRNPDLRYQGLLKQTETPEFKRWASTNGEVVTDAEGKPKILYHGSISDEPINTVRNKQTGFWMAFEPGMASPSSGDLPNVQYPFFVKAQKYYKLTPEEHASWRFSQSPKAFVKKLFEQGYDAVEIPDYALAIRNPSQVKSATGNSGEFSSTSKDIRYQDGPKRGKNLFAGVVDRLRATQHPAKVRLADSINRFSSQERQLVGRYYNPIVTAVESLPKESQSRVWNVLWDEMDSGKLQASRLTQAEDVNAYNEARRILAQMAKDQVADGQLLSTGQKRGINPTYFPSVISHDTITVLKEMQGSAKFMQLKRDFIQQQRKHGISQTEAEARFDKFVGRLDDQNIKTTGMEYNPVTEPEGILLPKSWIEKDLKVLFGRYTRNFARGRAYWRVFDRDPVFRANAGQQTYNAPNVGETAVPPSLLATEGRSEMRSTNTPEWRDFVDYIGGMQQQRGPVFRGIGALINSMLIGGPVTKLTDIATTPLKMVALVPAQHQGAVLKGILGWRQGIENAFRTGFNRSGGRLVAQDVLGATEQVTERMMQLAQGWTNLTQSERLERWGRGLAQSIGEYVGDVHRTLAQNGDQRSLEFLNKLGSDWATASREELGSRIGQIAQGKYDITNLPPWIYNSPFAPFMTMMKWSVEQTNNFINYAWKPMVERGDWWPMFATLASGIGGGLAIEELRSQVGGRKPNTATLEELRHAQGKPGYQKELLYKFLTAANLTGTAGILGEVIRQSYEAANGMLPQGFRYPAYEVTKDISSRVTSAYAAVQDGEDILDVMPQLVSDILSTHVQAARVILNQAGQYMDQQTEILPGVSPAERVQDANARRDLRVFDRLQGTPQTSVGPRSFPEYRTLTERRFDRASVAESIPLAQKLVQRAVQSGQTDPSRMLTRLRSARTIPQRLMPSFENDPRKFFEYFQFLQQTQGPERAAQVLRDFAQTEQSRKLKASLIPSVQRMVQ